MPRHIKATHNNMKGALGLIDNNRLGILNYEQKFHMTNIILGNFDFKAKQPYA